MSQPQFISHAQVVPPSVVPRRGMGFFSAIAIVLAILIAAGTAGIYLVNEQQKDKLITEQESLKEFKKEAEVSSIKAVEILQKRIEQGKSILDEHTYASQAINFIERFILNEVHLTQFAFRDNIVSAGYVAPGYVTYAQQIKYFRTLDEISSFTVSPPQLNEEGMVSFSTEITLSDEFLRSKPESSSVGGVSSFRPTINENDDEEDGEEE